MQRRYSVLAPIFATLGQPTLTGCAGRSPRLLRPTRVDNRFLASALQPPDERATAGFE